MAEPGITAPRKRPTTFTVSPGACRAAEHEHKDMLENSAKIQAFFKYFVGAMYLESRSECHVVSVRV